MKNPLIYYLFLNLLSFLFLIKMDILNNIIIILLPSLPVIVIFLGLSFDCITVPNLSNDCIVNYIINNIHLNMEIFH